MKPTSKQINDLKPKISAYFARSNMSKADLSRLSQVDPSQVSRILKGEFKTFSNHVIQICRVLGVGIPRLEAKEKIDREWAKTEATMKRLYSKSPESAVLVRRVLDAIADLHNPDRG